MKRTELTEMDYKGSGIKTLRGMATLMLILGIIGALSFIPLWSIEKSYHSEINILGIFYSITSFISGFFTQGICLGIATIAEGALIKTVAQSVALKLIVDREREIEAKEKAEIERKRIEEEEN